MLLAGITGFIKSSFFNDIGISGNAPCKGIARSISKLVDYLRIAMPFNKFNASFNG